MTRAGGECPASEPSLCEFPRFALRSLVDDEDDPAEVTLYPADADEESLATTWLTMPVDVAVDLAAAR